MTFANRAGECLLSLSTTESSRLGLFNACPHALSLAREPLVDGRRRINLNVG